ncbi:malate dehydrogenase [Bacteroidetes bacterium UKL13-3]|jgi:LDH2 family malate/lactate/ureidoglycolate dehydrogenase|nr:malate dehydrogenase [Bacteroidetes bacterium UKL13-3]HCP93224.1 malate dehydrogenase [Bacteroidota bacterium]
MNFSSERLLRFTQDVFEHCGMNTTDAKLAAEVLVTADMRGIDSHGLARLSGYVRLYEAGRAKMNPDWKVIHETPSTATIDADGGLGLTVAPKAMQIAIDKAKQVGTGWVAIQNSNHFGIAAYHAMMALEYDMIGIAMTNASPLVAPTHSKERMLGTNPMCYVFPAGKHKPVVVDLATSTAANGKLEIAQRANKQVPKGWIMDKNGNDTTDPNALKDGGVLLPLGSGETKAGHKGFGLSAVVDIFSAVLSGANYGPWVPPFVSFLDPVQNQPGKGIGHFVGAMRIDAFRPAVDFKQHMDNWIDRFKIAEPIDANIPVVIPGEPELTAYAERSINGIPLNDKVIEDLTTLAKKLKIEF